MAKAKYTVVARIQADDNSDISTWVTIGFAIPGRKEGEINVKLQTLPILKDCWDGWIYIREKEEPEEREEKFKQRARSKRVEQFQHDIGVDPEKDERPF